MDEAPWICVGLGISIAVLHCFTIGNGKDNSGKDLIFVIKV